MKKSRTISVIILIIFYLLVACNPPTATAPARIATIPINSPVPTEIPATNTVAPSNTPEPTLTIAPTRTLAKSSTPLASMTAVKINLPTDKPSTGASCPAGCTSSQPGCLIKGNISSSGEKIYHVPGGSSYDATEIDPSKGERWFCTAAEAVANGWRAVKN